MILHAIVALEKFALTSKSCAAYLQRLKKFQDNYSEVWTVSPTISNKCCLKFQGLYQVGACY